GPAPKPSSPVELPGPVYARISLPLRGARTGPTRLKTREGIGVDCDAKAHCRAARSGHAHDVRAREPSRHEVIEGENQAMLEVEDQDRALAFWTEKIGFEVVQDAPYGEDGRRLEVRTRDN